MERFVLHHGDCMAALGRMAEASVDAVVTDPPYHLTNNGGGPGGKGADNPYSRSRAGASSSGFMGMTWDGGDIAFRVELWAEVLRVLKPGGHLLAFSGSRTYHRMACAIEDAGFELRDQIMWVYGSGFPKSHNGEWGGTALKPAHEPIAMARKPLIGTVAENFAAHGTGALNIDSCRIAGEPMRPNTGKGALPRRHESEIRDGSPCGQPHELGRWPANLIHDGSDEVLEAFPNAPGQIADASASASARKTQNVYGAMRRGRGDEASAENENGGTVGFRMRPGARRLDEGSAARFFYCAKASRDDRNEGTQELPQKLGGMVSNTSGQHMTRRDEGYDRKPQGNSHPTVKPTDLMRYLCRLVTPPGGLVLDPFMGSGSTGKAAVLEGFRFVGCELDESYLAIARARIGFAARVGHQPSLLEAA